MKLHFTKMHGLGNDFVVLDFTTQRVELSPEQATSIADRHFGVGCDQILIVERSDTDGVDFKYRILNADGSEVGQCGNGARCFARYLHDKGLSDKNPVRVETLSGQMTLSIDPKTQLVTVNMGVPQFEPKAIPLAVDKLKQRYSISVEDRDVEFSALSMGNPHAVLIVEEVSTAPVHHLGALLESHAIFPARANIGFMQINNRKNISVRVYERGAGETIACGSGACAAVVAGIQMGLLDSHVTARLRGGDLQIAWAGDEQPVMMTGPAETTFEGHLTL